LSLDHVSLGLHVIVPEVSYIPICRLCFTKPSPQLSSNMTTNQSRTPSEYIQ
jgi:hypothetical protein